MRKPKSYNRRIIRKYRAPFTWTFRHFMFAAAFLGMMVLFVIWGVSKL